MVTREIPPALLRRHLGLPAAAEMDQFTSKLVAATGDGYAHNGDPWARSIIMDIGAISGDRIRLENCVQLTSHVLAEGLRKISAEKVAIIATTAGQWVDDEVDRLWKSERPDQAMFLAAYAGAMVEQLREQEIARLGNALATQGFSLLPHYSPGYDGWELEDQRELFAALGQRGPIELLPSCCLKPLRSMLAAVGVTREKEIPNRDGFWFFHDRLPQAESAAPTADYAFPERTLAKWSRQRLKFDRMDQDRLRAQFRFDGTTCSSLGMPLAMQYDVELQRRHDGHYQITNSSCQPCEGNMGHRDMCAVRSAPEQFMATIAAERPLLNQGLDDVLSWQPDVNPAGCLCLKSNRDHKWRIVLQTIHFALQNGEGEAPAEP